MNASDSLDVTRRLDLQLRQAGAHETSQPAEFATAYVMLADPQSSYISGATIAITGGKPFL